jgi:uroporphyrinogen III methyltransferase/synthase
LAAVGAATAEGLREAGLEAALVPASFRATAVAEALVAQGVAGRRVLVPQAEVAGEDLPARLRAAGAEVDVVAVYRTIAVAGGLDAVRAALLEGRCDAITFTSGSTVDAFVAGLGLPHAGLEAALRRSCLASIGPVTSDELRRVGFPPTVEARPSTIPGLVAALVGHYQNGGAAGGATSGPQREEPAR